MSSQPDTEQIQLARSLADPSKEKRHETVQALNKRLSAAVVMSELEMLKLWKALYYCMWLSDKTAIQMELATSLSNLTFSFTNPDLVLLFHRIFYRTILREWPQLDQHRINKFYIFIRSMLRVSFQYLMKEQWKAASIQSIMTILDEEILGKTPNGLRFHLADIFLPELLSTTQGNISTKSFLACMGPFHKAIKTTKDQIFHERVVQSVFRKFLVSLAIECQAKDKLSTTVVDGVTVDENDESNPESHSEKIYFTSVKTTALQKVVFDIASSGDINDGNRKKVYALHKEFFATTGQQFVEDDETENDVAVVTNLPTKSVQESKKVDASKKRKSDEVVSSEETKQATKGKSKASTPAAASAVVARKKDAPVIVENPKVVEAEKPEATKKQKSEVSEKTPVVEMKTALKKSSSVTATSNPPAANSAPAPTPTVVPFVASMKFAGAKAGYIFQMGKLGVGYYMDKLKLKKNIIASSKAETKPKRFIEEFIPSGKFTGARYGYTHRSGPSGVGYYHDTYTSPEANKKSSLASAGSSSIGKKSVKFGKN